MNHLIASGEPIIVGGQQGIEAISADIGYADAQVPQQGGIGMTWLLIIYAGIFFLMWLLMWRPQSKKRKAHMEMMKSLQVGDNIVTNGGLFGKIKDVGEDVYIVEFGTIKGISIPVAKNEVAGIREPKLTKTSTE
ncbi:MAG: preprotein translocase subunit YajC [Defluviitaleaceae bacterium]|nr:preprotein translocase subunit YajC [Defluviitaleaceae bacterium]